MLLIYFFQLVGATHALQIPKIADLFHRTPTAHDHLPSTANAECPTVWGPYRPDLYMGLRPRIAESAVAGLMWSHLDHGEIVDSTLRDSCDKDDSVADYGWAHYDPRVGGSQIINDTGNALDLVTEFLRTSNGGNEQDWVLRVRGTLHVEAEAGQATTVIFYLALEDTSESEARSITCTASEQMGDPAVSASCEGEINVLGAFRLQVREVLSPSDSEQRSKSYVHGLNAHAEAAWQAKDLYVSEAKAEVQFLMDNASHDTAAQVNGSMVFIQQVFKDAFAFDITFSHGSQASALETSEIDIYSASASTTFIERIETAFPPQPPFDTDAYRELSRDVLSNLLSGISFSHGDIKVAPALPSNEENERDFWKQDPTTNDEPLTSAPTQLFHLVSSRNSSAGSLWADGFHLLLVLDLDADLALEVLRSWLARTDEAGWIACEQVLGSEMRLQNARHANPPTLYLVVSAFIEMLEGRVPYHGYPSQFLSATGEGSQLLERLYPLLQKHYLWFRNSQAGELAAYKRPEADFLSGFRWRGRIPQYTNTSGLNDYPRAEPPHPGELHVDALAWVGSMAETLANVAAHLHKPRDYSIYNRQRIAVSNSIEALHWSEKEQTYCDATVSKDKHTLVCHKGYISLFPLMLGYLDPEHPHLNDTLNLIERNDTLWTEHGIRSLSRRDPLYRTGENRWRSPVFVNINFLVLVQLLNKAQEDGPYQQRCLKMYNALRRNMVNTVFDSWRETGTLWEQYHPQTGKGQGTSHFTGWTALVVKMMAMPDLEEPSQPEPEVVEIIVQDDIHALTALLGTYWVLACSALVALLLRRRIIRLVHTLL